MRRFLLIAIAIGFVAAALPAAAAKKKDKKTDEVWVHPEYASHGVNRIALLPVVSYDNNFKAEAMTEARVGQAFASSGYRWISAGSARSLIQSAGGDSTLKALRQSLLENPRLDSLAAAGMCARLRCDAVLGVRIDHWEQMSLTPDQSGKPSSTVTVSAAMVGSTGSLLWSALGSQTQEGPYQTASVASDGGDFLRSQRRSDGSAAGAGGAPSFEEVLDLLFKRWGPKFPAAAAPPATPPAGSSSAAAPADTSRAPAEPK
jgi:hypothetical protein